MKIKIAVTLCLLLLVSTFAFANVPEMTVEKIISSGYDHQIVSVTGIITEQVRNEKFIFQDDTGTILIEIDEEDWPRYNTPLYNQQLNIICEVEKDYKAIKLEAKRINVL